MDPTLNQTDPQGKPKWLAIVTPFFVGLVGTLIMFRQVIGHDLNTLLWADDFDSKFIRWTLEWSYHALFHQGAGLEVWNSNSYFPASLTLTHSDGILSAQLLYGPLRLLGASPGTALYLTLAGFCILGASLTAVAARRSKYFTPAEQALVVFCSHFTLVVTSFVYHYQLVGMQLAPPFLLFLLLYLRDLRVADLLGCLASFSLGFCFSTYLGPMALTLAACIISTRVLATLISGNARRAMKDLRGAITPRIVTCAILLTIAFGVSLYFVQVRPYLQGGAEAPPRDFSEIAVYSARPTSLFVEPSNLSLIYARFADYEWGDWERAYFPGYVLLFTAFAALTLRMAGHLRRSGPRTGPANAISIVERIRTHPSEPWTMSFIVIFLASYLLSWGPYAPSYEWVKFPYYWISQIIPGLRDVRAPGRFGMLLGLPLGFFAVLVLNAFVTARGARARHFAPVVLGCLIALESIPSYQTRHYRIPHHDIYASVARVSEPGTPLLELPAVGSDHLGTINRAMDQMLGSTLHWCRIVAGYGARSTPEYDRTIALDQAFLADPNRLQELVSFAQSIRVERMLVHTADYPDAQQRAWLKFLDALPQERVLFRQDGSFLMVVLEPENTSEPSLASR